ncbi:iron complex transport system substrate-binding protein [Bhargavaea ginsengi]|jgi:iron complex transport system substrate-binding protein|uniref:Iron complex transport system substrate-binding protein n=1 Tax=Bhargavaea ginsengi TaxID=426757 RepID=A0A1H7BP97_9BACL|nr:siderophore ABC transporter substrate-binding protein [Bhargavaea ginsengi]SEJ75235.1 iron complex transport system substrate-binding protein [Bhargavaea ginsengi]
MKKFTFLAMLMAFILILGACGSDNAEKAEENSGTSGEATEETTEDSKSVTIEHELGEATIEGTPEKVVVFDFGILDTLDELGVDVAGLPQASVPGYLEQYASDDYTNTGSLKEPDFEAIHALQPDVIFISGRQAQLYDQFAEIAPTVYIPIDTTNYVESFKENMNTVAEIFGKEDEMNKELEDIDSRIADIQEKTSASEEKGLIVLGTQSKVSAYGPASRFGLIHDVFGVKPADEGIESSTHGQNITFEYILDTNPDILYVIDRDAAIGEDSSVKESFENDLVQKTNAYKNDKIHYLNGEYWYLSGGGLQSMKEMISEIEGSL